MAELERGMLDALPGLVRLQSAASENDRRPGILLQPELAVATCLAQEKSSNIGKKKNMSVSRS
jgi:hypothetical protein